MSSDNIELVSELDPASLQMEKVEAYFKILAESQLANAKTMRLIAEKTSHLESTRLDLDPTHRKDSVIGYDAPSGSGLRRVKRSRSESGESFTSPIPNKKHRIVDSQSKDKDSSALLLKKGAIAKNNSDEESVSQVSHRNKGNMNQVHSDNQSDYSSDEGSVNYSNESDSQIENAEFHDLENAILRDSSPVNDNSDLPVIGCPSNPTWEPSKKALEWYRKVADIEIKYNEFNEIKAKFSPNEEISRDFTPPEVPPIISNSLKPDSSEMFKQNALSKSQEFIFTAMAPLLDVLKDSEDRSIKSKVASSIQMLCTANLKLNRFRRALLSPLIKNEYRKSMLSSPISHNSLFGDSFDKCAEDAIKEQSSSHKVLSNSSQKQSFKPKPSSSNTQFFRQNQSKQYPRSEISSYQFRGRGRGRGRPYSRGKQRGYLSHRSN